MPRPVHFEIHADDPARARKFYQSVFGWSVQQWGDTPYWLVDTGQDGPGINGGLLRRRGSAPSADNPVSAFVITMSVTDLDATVGAVDAAGGSVAVRKHAMPGLGWLAYCKDSEGNVFGLMQNDPQAA